jgi:hypothetical protein
MVGWGLRLLLPDTLQWWTLAMLIVLELAVPMWAERCGATTWDAGHIVERYGLFTLIVLGESVLAATLAIQSAVDEGEGLSGPIWIAAGGVLIVFAMWWIYFAPPADVLVVNARTAILAVAVPVALYVANVWCLHAGAERAGRSHDVMVWSTIVLVVAAGLAALPVIVIGALLVALVMASELTIPRRRVAG